jgi:hypothetical protein
MLCLARAICIWGNEIMPAFMAGRTQKRLWPTVCFIAKEMKWSPVMAFCTIGAAHFTFMPRVFWLHLTWFKSCSNDNLFGNEVGSSMPAVAHEKVLNRPALVLAFNDLPSFSPAALGARIGWPLKSFFHHG